MDEPYQHYDTSMIQKVKQGEGDRHDIINTQTNKTRDQVNVCRETYASPTA